MPRKSRHLPKHHAGQVRRYRSLSFSAPIELEEYMDKAAERKGMNRSAWLCWLVTQYLWLERGLSPPAAVPEEPPPKIPTRRKQKSS
jgi:hypothetical protein